MSVCLSPGPSGSAYRLQSQSFTPSTPTSGRPTRPLSLSEVERVRGAPCRESTTGVNGCGTDERIRDGRDLPVQAGDHRFGPQGSFGWVFTEDGGLLVGPVRACGTFSGPLHDPCLSVPLTDRDRGVRDGRPGRVGKGLYPLFPLW